MVNNVTSRLMTNALISGLNMKGSWGNKVGFIDTALCKLIIESITKSHTTTETIVITLMANKLRNAPKCKGSQAPVEAPCQSQTLWTSAVPSAGVYPSYRGLASKVLGILQIILGVISLVLNGLCIDYCAHRLFVDSTLWCAVLYIVAGAFGIASRKKRRSMVTVCMVLSTLAAVMAIMPFVLAILSLLSPGYLRTFNSRASSGTHLAFNILLAIVSLAEILTAVLASVFCCKVVCGSDKQPNPPATHEMYMKSGEQHADAQRNPLLVHPGPDQPTACSIPPGHPTS